MAEPFDSPWLKWAQAVVDAEVLEKHINDLAGQGVLQIKIRLAQEYDAKRHCIVITAGPEVPRVFPVSWGLLLGNIVHNCRSSLDHLAWALYKRGRTPNLTDWQEQGVYFPIATSRDQFNGWIRGKRPKLPGVRRTDIAIVRRYQPYTLGKRFVNQHVFRVLDELARADKHRVIQPVQAVPERTRFKVTDVRDCTITRLRPRARRVALEPGAELVRFFVRKTGPNPEIDVEPTFAVDPTVDGRFTFENWANGTLALIKQLLREFAAPPESITTMLRTTPHESPPESG